MRARRSCSVVLLGAGLIAAACGGTELGAEGTATDAGVAVDAILTVDATSDSTTDSGPAATACIPGRSVACVGPVACASAYQVCSADGTAYGPCGCAQPVDASVFPEASTPPPCVPGQSIACTGPGGCISSQVCNAQGSGYGACACTLDGGTPLLCVPGQSIACGGPYGCASFQVCNGTGSGYGPCDCPDAFSYLDDAGAIPDGYAPLPPPVGDQPYNALWSASQQELYLPLFSAPDCIVIPPYGSYYNVAFVPPGQGIGPSGTFPTCAGNNGPCYQPMIDQTGGSVANSPGDTYTLSAFGGDGLASGQMNSDQGIIPLVVKSCP